MIEDQLKKSGYALPVLPQSKGLYKRCVQVGRMLYVSGHISVNADGSPITGKLGAGCSEEEGVVAARQCGLAILAAIKEHFGSLEPIHRVVKLLGMVNAVPDFTNHAVIINGCSEVFRNLWGEELGVGARSAVGMGSLPGGVAVEIEAIFELKQDS